MDKLLLIILWIVFLAACIFVGMIFWFRGVVILILIVGGIIAILSD